jgi:hypothetical protein
MRWLQPVIVNVVFFRDSYFPIELLIELKEFHTEVFLTSTGLNAIRSRSCIIPKYGSGSRVCHHFGSKI